MDKILDSRDLNVKHRTGASHVSKLKPYVVRKIRRGEAFIGRARLPEGYLKGGVPYQWAHIYVNAVELKVTLRSEDRRLKPITLWERRTDFSTNERFHRRLMKDAVEGRLPVGYYYFYTDGVLF